MKTILALLVLLLIPGCAADNDSSAPPEQIESPNPEETTPDKNEPEENNEEPEYPGDESEEETSTTEDFEILKEKINDKFQDSIPTAWGENVPGVITNINTEEKIVALTFDACDGTPDSYDAELIQFLVSENIPATLFINAQWIEANEEIFMELADQPLFEIANHGHLHKPLSVTGESAYNIRGTENVEEVFDEVYKNQELIHELTGEYPHYFRSGTAYYDDVAVEIVEELGLKAVNYNVLGDAGGTFTHSQIVNAFGTAQPGSIFLFHMNQPHTDINSGVQEGVHHLRENGFEFVQLGEYDEWLVE